MIDVEWLEKLFKDPLQIETMQWQDFIKTPVQFKKYKKRKRLLCDNIFCFDIEVTSFFVEPKTKNISGIADLFKRFKFNPRRVEKFFDTCEFGALPYVWQFTMDGKYIIMGRELSEFADFIKALNHKVRAHYVIHVHNLAYEYHHIREYFDFDDVFFTEARKPLYCRYDCVEFRCTYRLTNLSLAKWGEQCGVEKKVGDLDYTLLRTPLSELSSREKNYCIYDLLVMVKGLQVYLKKYGHIHDIPYTLTGQIRKPVKELHKDDFSYKKWVAEMQPKNFDEYLVFNKVFSGGWVGSNPRYTNVLLHNLKCKDIASAYPWQVFSQKYPSAPFTEVNAPCDWFDGNHHICLVEFIGLECVNDICCISASKRVMGQGMQFDDYTKKDGAFALNNGKIRYADRLVLYICEQDYAYICRYYKWHKMVIHSHRIAPSEYIDIKFILMMLGLYKGKTELKGVDPEIYLQSKALLNSMSYGLMATAPCRDRYYEDDEYKPQSDKCGEIMGNAQLQEFRDKPWKNVVPYCHGLYVTAYERKRLLLTALKFSDGKHNRTAYGDTDSLKGLYTPSDMLIFEKENEKVLETIERICKERNIDPYLLAPKDKNGTAHPLGIWEDDGNYFEFKTMHAKSYAYKLNEDDKIHITIAGVPKKCADVLKRVDDLRNGLTFDMFHSRKNVTAYIDGDNPQVTMPDGYKVKNICGINLRPTSYKLTLTEEYKELLCMYGNKRNLGCI